MSAQSEQEDKVLIEKVASGDRDALDKLYLKHSPAIGTFVRKKLYDALSALEAADIVQEVFLRVQQKAGSYKPHGRVLSWIRKIAQNIIKDFIRQNRARQKRETNYALVRPPQGGEVERPERPTWEYGDPANAPGGIFGKGKDMPIFFLVRRPKRGGRDPLRKWMDGVGRDDVLGMFRCFGLAPEEEK